VFIIVNICTSNNPRKTQPLIRSRLMLLYYNYKSVSLTGLISLFSSNFVPTLLCRLQQPTLQQFILTIVQVSHVYKLYLLYLLTYFMSFHPPNCDSNTKPHKTSSTNLILILDDCQSFNSKFFHDWILAHQTQKETLQGNNSSKVKYTGIAVHKVTLSNHYRNSHVH